LPGYRLKDLKYTVSFAGASGAYGYNTISGRGKVVGAAAKGLAKVTNFVHQIGVKRNVDKKLEEMYPDIRKAMRNHTGVMVVIQYQQAKAGHPDFNPPELLAVMLGPSASNLPSAIRKWEQASKIVRGPDDRMIFGPCSYLWFTEDPAKKESMKKTELLNLEK
jgi:hypothetical protein